MNIDLSWIIEMFAGQLVFCCHVLNLTYDEYIFRYMWIMIYISIVDWVQKLRAGRLVEKYCFPI